MAYTFGKKKMNYLNGTTDPIGDAELDEIEEVYQIRFPHTYREFIKRHNGGIADSDDERFQYLLFLAVGDVPSSISSSIYERQIDHLIPFAESTDQDPICFDFRDHTIWFLNEKIADSFEEFVKIFLRPIFD